MENGEENYILLVIDHPTSVFAIPINELRDNLDNLLDKNRRAYFAEKKGEQFFIKLDENGQFPINEFLLGKCSVPQIDSHSSIGELGHPFDALFENLEQAHEMLDFWKETILVLQDEETERSKPLVLTSRRQGKKVWIVLNFGQWVVLSFSSTEGLWVTLQRDLLNELKGENFEGGFSEKLDGVKYTHKQLDLNTLLVRRQTTDDTLVKSESVWRLALAPTTRPIEASTGNMDSNVCKF